MSATTIRMIHVACRQLGLDTDTRKALQLQVTGKDSLAAMNAAEIDAVLGALKERGFRPFRPGSGKGARPKARNAQLRYVHVLWSLLATAEALRKPGRAGLNAFVREGFEKKWGAVPLDIDMLSDPEQVRDVTEALKAWCKRLGIEVKK